MKTNPTNKRNGKKEHDVAEGKIQKFHLWHWRGNYYGQMWIEITYTFWSVLVGK